MMFEDRIFEKLRLAAGNMEASERLKKVIFSARGAAKTFGFGGAKDMFLLLTDSA